ncbi:MAG: PAS domain S-box protein [Gemmatimonadaceae bacterium]
MRPPVTAQALSARLGAALKQLNEASGSPHALFSDAWIVDRSGAQITSARAHVLPPEVSTTLRDAGNPDSLVVVGPVPLVNGKLRVLFVQPVRAAPDSNVRARPDSPIAGALVLGTEVDAATLRSIGVASPDGGEDAAFVVHARDTLYEYVLSRRAVYGYNVRAWNRALAPVIQHGAAQMHPGALALDPSGTVLTAHVSGLPWGLIRRADRSMLYLAADAELGRELALAMLVLICFGFLTFVRHQRDQLKHLRSLAASESALQQSEEHYRLLFDMNPMPMWAFDAGTGAFLSVNSAAIKHYGYSRDEMLCMTIFDIRPPEYVTEIRPVEERIAGKAAHLPGRHHQKKDGTLIDVDVTVHPLYLDGRPARLALLNDITQTRKVEAAFRESSQFIRAILDSSPIAIIATDLDLNVVQWNPAAERLFGWKAEEVIGGRNPIVPYASTEFHEMLAVVRSKHRITNRDQRRACRDGTTVKVDISVALIQSATGEPAGFVALAADLTERIRLEGQLLQAQKMEVVGQLSGGIAHDFNNLLTVITTYTELLMTQFPEPSPVRADLQEIKGAGGRAAALTRQLLAFSRKQVLEPRVIDLNDVVCAVEQMCRRVLPPSIQVVTSLDPELDAAYADVGQIEQVLMNLVINARDAMPDGGTLTMMTRNAAPLVECDPAHARETSHSGTMITVSDTGCGMSPDVIARIFEPFFTTKDVGKGTGLGLPTAYGIMHQSGGRLDVASEPGVGTTFTMYLPAMPCASAVMNTAERATANATTDSTASHVADVCIVDSDPAPHAATGVVLLVDDEPAVRAVAARILEQAGYTVHAAAGGAEALALHATLNGAVDLVVTDMVMPSMTGTAIATELRMRQPQLPVIIMSGLPNEAMAREVAGDSVSILRKPFSPQALTRKVAEAIRTASPIRSADDLVHTSA